MDIKNQGPISLSKKIIQVGPLRDVLKDRLEEFVACYSSLQDKINQGRLPYLNHPSTHLPKALLNYLVGETQFFDYKRFSRFLFVERFRKFFFVVSIFSFLATSAFFNVF